MSEPFFPTDDSADDESDELLTDEFPDEITGREALAEPTIELGQEDQIELFVEPVEDYRTVERTLEEQLAADQERALAESEAVAKATEAMLEETGHYRLDRAEGRIEFGDGLKGEIPGAGEPVEAAAPDRPLRDGGMTTDEGEVLQVEGLEVVPEMAEEKGVETTPEGLDVDGAGEMADEMLGMATDDHGLGGAAVPGTESAMSDPFGMDPGGSEPGGVDDGGLKPSAPVIDWSGLGGTSPADPAENRGIAGAPVFDPGSPMGGGQAMDGPQSTPYFTPQTGHTPAPSDGSGDSPSGTGDSGQEDTEDPFAEGAEALEVDETDGSSSLRAMPRPDGWEGKVTPRVEDIDRTLTPTGVTDPGPEQWKGGGRTSVDHTKHPGMVTDPAEPPGGGGDWGQMQAGAEQVTDPPETDSQTAATAAAATVEETIGVQPELMSAEGAAPREEVVEKLTSAPQATREEASLADLDANRVTSVTGDDADLAQVDLQSTLQKQQSLLRMMSTKTKQLVDTAMSVIRKMGR